MLFRLKYIILTMCQLILFAGTYILDYSTRNKLGMNRWLMYNNMQWERKYPIQVIKVFLALSIVFFTILILFTVLKSIMRQSKLYFAMSFVSSIIAIVIALYLLFGSVNSTKIYYLNCVIFIAIYILQVVKIIVLKQKFAYKA